MQRNSGKLSVAFLYDDSLDRPDGVSQYVRTLGAWLAKGGHKVTYLVGQSKLPSYAGGKVYSLSKNLPVSWGGSRLSISVFPKLKAIKKILDQEDFDVIHVQFPYSPFMAKLVINAAKPQTAIVGTVHIYPANRLAVDGSRALKIIYGKSLKRIDKVISVSRAAANYADDVFKLQTDILPNVVDLAKYQSTAMVSQQQSKHIVFLGRLVKRKGCQQLLEAFRLLLKKDADVHLSIGGQGPLRTKLERYAKNYGLENNVKFLGFVPEEAKPSLLASAAIACFPSLYGECFGIVLIEAMAAGSGVVIGGDNEGYRSVLGSRPSLLVNPREPQDFADRLYQLLNNSALAKKLHQWQQAEINQYDVAVVGPKLVELYKETIAKRRSSMHNLG